ncbi:hypothetical protein [Olivibacter jilunii]|uniref:hypothetical protein n=1 Tax=Olivibacter jilunii TaxID=985016 RepID=UPI003F170001
MDILKPGNILHVKDYEFENGGEPRDKYLIVIDVSEEKSLLLRVLTTSRIHVPEHKMMHGCRKEPENGLHYFMFEKARCIGTHEGNDFFFVKHTFLLFRNNIKAVELEAFIRKYINIARCVCTIEEQEFKRIKKCIRQNSDMADRSAKRSFPHLF